MSWEAATSRRDRAGVHTTGSREDAAVAHVTEQSTHLEGEGHTLRYKPLVYIGKQGAWVTESQGGEGDSAK